MARRRDTAVTRPGGRRAAARPADAAGRPPLLALVGVLEAFPRDWLVHLPDLQAHAARRGVRRLVGTRDAAGGLVEPALIAEVLDPGDWVRPAGFELARHAATLVLRVSRRVRLADRLTGAPVPVVAGILLDRLRAYHGYALVADGGPAVPLTVRVGRRRLFEELWKAGVLETEDGTPATDYDPDAAYRLRLDQLPAAPPAVAAADLAGTFDELARLRVLTSLVAARLKGESAEYSPEQVEELRRHYLTPGLHLSFPTTTPYTDLKKALAEGTVGTRTGYRIDVGTRDVLSLSKFRPASEFLDRVYEALPGPTPEERVYRHRRLSPRTRLTKADEFMKRLSDDFLGVAPNGSAVATLEAVGAADLATIVRDRAAGKQPARRTLIEALSDARRKLETRREAAYREKLAPLVFHVGATGRLPAGIDARPQTAEQITAKYPALAPSKDERAGTFYEIGDAILTVYETTEYYSR
jgi:hypothetical protein